MDSTSDALLKLVVKESVLAIGKLMAEASREDIAALQKDLKTLAKSSDHALMLQTTFRGEQIAIVKAKPGGSPLIMPMDAFISLRSLSRQ